MPNRLRRRISPIFLTAGLLLAWHMPAHAALVFSDFFFVGKVYTLNAGDFQIFPKYGPVNGCAVFNFADGQQGVNQNGIKAALATVLTAAVAGVAVRVYYNTGSGCYSKYLQSDVMDQVN